MDGANDRPEHYEAPGALVDLPAAIWEGKTVFTTYPIKNQGSAYDCVWNWLAKSIAVWNMNHNGGAYIELSPKSGYCYTYQSQGGCNSIQAADFAYKNGVTLESLLPSNLVPETQLRDPSNYTAEAKYIAKVAFCGPPHVSMPSDFESIAAQLQDYQNRGVKAVIGISVQMMNNGTTFTAFPRIPSFTPLSDDPRAWYHRITITDFGIINGQKVLAVDNSGGTSYGNNGQQYLTKDWEPFLYGALRPVV